MSKSDGLHCVYGQCQAAPHFTTDCNPGCYFQMSTDVLEISMSDKTTARERDQTDAGQCITCKWSGWNIARTHYETRLHTAQCRRYPPPHNHRQWPTVAKYDGCGEWSETNPKE